MADSTLRDGIHAANPHLRWQLVDDLIQTVRAGAFGPDVPTVASNMLMGGTLNVTPELLDLAHDKAWLLTLRHEQNVLRQVADAAMLERVAEDAQAGTGQATAGRKRARL